MKKRILFSILMGVIFIVTMISCALVRVESISVKPERFRLMVGETFKLDVTVLPKDASNKKVSFKSSDTSIATVSADGLITAKAPGQAIITITSKDNPKLNATCTVAISKPQISQNAQGHMVLEWNAVQNAVSYDIYHSGSRLGEKTMLVTTTKTTYIHTAPNSIKYENYYTVVPKDSQGRAIVTIKWNKIDNADAYLISRYNAATDKFDYVGSTTSDNRVFTEAVENFDFDIDYRVDPVNDELQIVYGNFDTDSPEHNQSGIKVRAFSITRNIILKYENPKTISLERDIFGDNVYFYDAKYDDMEDILADVNRIADAMRSHSNDSQMSAERHALYFKPGAYPLEASDARGIRLDVGFYMTVAGLGLLPTETRIGSTIYTPPALAHSNNYGSNGTHNFWRALENFEIYKPTPQSNVTLGWAVSQAAPIRRLYVSPGVPTDYQYNSGWVSGGFAADVYFGGSVSGGGQQQFYTRNCEFAGGVFSGVSWNNFVIASTGDAFTSNYMTGGSKTWIAEGIDQMKEKPFLFYDTTDNEYKVFVPGLRQNALGTSWTTTDPGQGDIISLKQFYIAKPGDPAAKINSKLDNGLNVFLTPGMYDCEVPVKVTKKDTVVLGTGLATLSPTQSNKEGAMLVSDVSGITLAGFIVDANTDSKYLLRIGEVGSNNNHSADPTFISDVFARVGGFRSYSVNAEVSVDIHSNNVIGDHFWIWLADHGRGIGWDRNTGAFGLLVHGDDVTMHGLFVEHYQKYQTLWLGERGRVFFYQNEIPYPVPNQESWLSRNGQVNGWAAFKVAEFVNEFYGIGFGSYSTLRNKNIALDCAYEVPNGKSGIILEALFINRLTEPTSDIYSVINGVGGRGENTNGKRIAYFSGNIAKQYQNGQLVELETTPPVPENYNTLLSKVLN